MKKLLVFTVIMFVFTQHSFSQDGKQISDCIITYNVSVQDSKADPQVVKTMNGAIKTLYLKGNKSRSDLETSGFRQTTLYDTKTDSTVILREMGSNKYISYLDGNKRRSKNQKYEGITFTGTTEKKTILGYECKKVIAKLADNSVYNVYYTTSIMPVSSDYEYQFKNLPGFVLEYESESEDGKMKINYIASKITLGPVPGLKFEIPKSGYRIL